jgi:hypothetical protein
MLTSNELSAATGDALQRLIAKVADAAYEDARDTNQKFEDALVDAAVNDVRQTDALERLATVVEAVNAKQLNKAQQAFLQVYEMCLAIRKTSLSTSTTDATHQDIVSDAAKMAVFVWPTIKAELVKMELPPGALDWN